MARQTLNHVKRLSNESPDAASSQVSTPFPQACTGSAQQEGPVGGPEGAAGGPVS